MPFLVILVDGEDARIIGEANTENGADDLIAQDFEANSRKSPQRYTIAGPTITPKEAKRVESVEVDDV